MPETESKLDRKRRANREYMRRKMQDPDYRANVYKRAKERYSPEKTSAQHKKWYAANKVRLAAERRADREARNAARTCPPPYLAYREDVRAIRRANGEMRNVQAANLARKVMALLLVSGDVKCVKCDERDIRVLVLNHINGDGHKEKRRTGGNNAAPLYIDIVAGRRETAGLEVMCHNCNVLHEYTLGRRRLPKGSDDIIAAARNAWEAKIA